MSKSQRALEDLMKAVDAGYKGDSSMDSASSDSSKLLGPPRRRSTTYYGGGARPKSAPRPAVAVVDHHQASSDASFEFSAAVSYSAASPASMVFSDGQLRAHQFPAVRPSASASPVRSSSVGSYDSTSTTTKRHQAGVTGGSKKRVSFATGGADKAAAAGKGKKSGGLLGCMASACGPSSGNDAVEPAATRNANRKVVAF